MRVAWVIMLVAWLASYAPGSVAAKAALDAASGTVPTGVTLFHDSAFVFVPTPTQEPDNPLFYRGSFKAAPAQQAAVSALTTAPAAVIGPPAATPAPGGTAPAASTVAPTGVSSATPTSTAVAAPSSTPVPTIAAVRPTSPPPTVTPTPFVLGAVPDARFHEGGFYLPPLTPNPIDEPDNYRGSVTADPGGVLRPSMAGELPAAPFGAVAPASHPAGPSYEVLQPTYWEQSPLPVFGRAMYYNPGIMSAVYTYRLQNQEVRPCAECVGYVALLRAGDLNRKVWLRWEDGTIEGPFLVIDVAARHHVPLLLRRNWVVDVDYQTALRLDMSRPLAVTVLALPPYITADAPGAPDFRMEVTFR